MPNSKNPGWIQFEYITEHAPHSQEIPVNTPIINTGSPIDSEITCWDASTIPWVTMADALVAQMADRFPTTTDYVRATLWSQPLAEDLPVFVASYVLTVPGTVTPAGYNLATQETVTARDSAGYLAKLVFLDMASGDSFDRQDTLVGAGLTDLWAEWSAESNGWASQAGYRPTTFIKATRTLNEALRRQYHQT